MITIAICDDEPYFTSELELLINEYSHARNLAASVLVFSDGKELLASARETDLILMDIKFPQSNGMETVEKLRARGNGSPVIFITAYPQYVFRAFDVDAVHYILKPVTAQKLFPALDKAVKLASGRGKTLLVTNGNVTSKIPVKDIVYCEAFDHRITVHTLTGRTDFFGTLDSVQKELDERFFRCHRSYLVNMDFVTDRDGGLAVMADGGRAIIARRKQPEFVKRLLDRCRRGFD